MAVLKAGSRLKSAVCSSELMVVVAPAGDVNLTCGGAPVIDLGEDATGGDIDAAHKNGTQMGKRYTNEAKDIGILCTKPAGQPRGRRDSAGDQGARSPCLLLIRRCASVSRGVGRSR